MNWMSIMLLGPATIMLPWMMIREKLRGNVFSSELVTVSLLLGAAIVGVAELNSAGKVWLGSALLVAQLILLVLLFKRLWTPLKQKLGGK